MILIIFWKIHFNYNNKQYLINNNNIYIQKINLIRYLFKFFRKLLKTKDSYLMKCENDKVGSFKNQFTN